MSVAGAPESSWIVREIVEQGPQEEKWGRRSRERGREIVWKRWKAWENELHDASSHDGAS